VYDRGGKHRYRDNRSRRQCHRPAKYFYETQRRESIHHGFKCERIKIICQSVRHRANDSERRGAK